MAVYKSFSTKNRSQGMGALAAVAHHHDQSLLVLAQHAHVKPEVRKGRRSSPIHMGRLPFIAGAAVNQKKFARMVLQQPGHFGRRDGAIAACFRVLVHRRFGSIGGVVSLIGVDGAAGWVFALPDRGSASAWFGRQSNSR